MKKTQQKAKPNKAKVRKVRIPKKNVYILFWTLILFILSIPLLVFIQGKQDIRQHAAESACVPAGGTCKPAGNCGTAETDAGEKDCSSDGSLTCCVPQSVGCLGSCSTPPAPTYAVVPSPVIPTDTPMFNGFLNPSAAVTTVPTQAPQPLNQQLPTDTPTPTSPLPSLSVNPSSILPSQATPSTSTTPGGNGTINNNLLSLLLDLIKKILDFFLSLIGNIGGHHSGSSGGNHNRGHDQD